MNKEKENRVTDETGYKFDTGSQAGDATQWIKNNWSWMPDEEREESSKDKERLKKTLKEKYGEERWEEEYRKFTTEYPDFE